jgi:squalene-hopene/tetraprenyl-beta-curcumene cyclase
MRCQYADGYWMGELESNATMEAEYILLSHFLGAGDEQQWRKLTNRILSEQRDDGTWGQFYGAPGDLSTSVECYFALKLAGISPDEPMMRKAKDFILTKGGVSETRVFTKIWLALFGQWDWKGVPAMPAEIMLLPDWFPVSIYDFSSWARATIVPLLILIDRKPVKPIPESARIDELYEMPRDQTDYSTIRPKRLIGWETFFYAGDTVLRQLERLPWKPTRGQAIKRAEEWIVQRQGADGSWGGIQPPWVYSLMALSSLGYPNDHPVMSQGLAGFQRFSIEDGDTLRIQACLSPLWDTALATIALLDAGTEPDHPALVRAGEWILKEQILTGGDWQVKAKSVPPGGWAFEFHNDIYPDLDDTSEIVLALSRLRLPPEMAKSSALERAVQWTLGMQSNNGGWASFDKNNTKSIIAKIPFADFGEALDPPSVDVTAHMLEMLGRLGYSSDHPSVAKALEYVLSEQEHDGAWFGRWGVNYIYGTAAVLPALEALGFDMSADCVRRAVRWMIDHQNPDGGWGESCSSYADERYRGKGPSAPSQTAWALLALIAAGEDGHDATARGVDHLLRTQRQDGSWDEPYFTGTGFPGYGVGQRLDRYLTPEDSGYQGEELPAGFMINYHMYRTYWPLMALGRYRRSLRKALVTASAGQAGAAERVG